MSLSFALRGGSRGHVRAASVVSRFGDSAAQGTAELHKAIWSDQLSVHYQPQFELPGGSLVGVEALVRWYHPRRGVLAPAEFLPLAERGGLMPALTTSVLAAAAGQAARWWRAGHRVTVAVNISPSSITPGLVDDVARTIDAFALPPGTLRLELTEDLRVDDVRRVQRTLLRLRDLGVWISADDFGSGCSSFALLRALPIDEIKIDRSFVQQVCGHERSRTIVQSVIDLSAALGIQSVAEGIEDAATLNLLRDMQCDVAQGFFLGRPTPPEGIDLLLGQPGG
jgi:EAL domain-containing protein (putative c-di-GMP-specific phosphodiesterase class I)